MEEAPSHVRFFTYAYAVIVALAFAPLTMAGLVAPAPLSAVLGVLGFLALAGVIVVLVKFVQNAGKGGAKHAAYLLTGILVLVALPIAGLLVDGAADNCVGSKCDPNFRPLAMPQVFGLVPLHVVSVVAFFLSARRPEALSPLSLIHI